MTSRSSAVRPVPGIQRVAGEPSWPRTALADRWRTATVDPAADLPEAYAELARALVLPDWFGANLDALWDVLTDLTTPTALLWRGWRQLAPPDASRLLPVLTARTEQAPDFAVVLGHADSSAASRSASSG